MKNNSYQFGKTNAVSFCRKLILNINFALTLGGALNASAQGDQVFNPGDPNDPIWDHHHGYAITDCPDCPIGKVVIATDAYSKSCLRFTQTWFLGGNTVTPPPSPLPLWWDQYMGSTPFDIGTCNEYPFILKANNKERIFITPNGNVGIGANNSAPSAALDVSDGGNGHLKIYGDGQTIEGTAGLVLTGYGSVGVADNFNVNNKFFVNADGYTEIGIYPNAMPTFYGTSPRVLTIRDMTNNRDLFAITSTGKTYAREVEISLVTNFPDYVFDKNYKLAKISEVAKYIEKNKHLQGFEKGEYYEKNGVNINDMLLKQQEKIEELTLYIIQLEKRLSDLEKK